MFTPTGIWDSQIAECELLKMITDICVFVIDKPWLLSRFWVYCKLYHSLATFHCLTPNEAEPSLGQTVKGHQIMI